jgi:putative component of membrane protein insertase Oxa1/YidC/SpoIIIJ protein YidD
MNRFCLLFLLILLFPARFYPQQKKEAVQSVVLENAFKSYAWAPAEKRKVLSFKHKGIAARFNPVNFLAAGMLFFYQRVLSEQIQANCNYVVSCSEYTKLSIQEHGFIKGLLQGVNQLNNCMPGISQDYPAYKITPELKINNATKDE